MWTSQWRIKSLEMYSGYHIHISKHTAGVNVAVMVVTVYDCLFGSKQCLEPDRQPVLYYP